VVRQFVAEHTAEIVNQKLAKQVQKQADKVAAKATKHIEKLDRLADHLDAVEVWTRHAGHTRKPRMSRHDIARTAIAIADAEGLDALSMRRIAAELDVGTMSLYHYVRTKQELLTLVMDEMMGEVLIPAGTRLPRDWRAAATMIARRSRDSLLRHAWVLDIADDPPIGPNAMRHFDQTLEAISSFDAPLDTKFELMFAIDEYVFGYCLQSRNNLRDDQSNDVAVLRYMAEMFDGGDYPTISSLVHEHGFDALWHRINEMVRDPKRFDRNLARLLDGFEASAKRR
jgi:AcrR family transcriptional regulator